MNTGKTRAFQKRAGPPPPVDARAVAAGVIVVTALTVFMSAILAVAIYTTTITEAHVSGLLYYLGLASVAAGGAVAARRARGRGLIHGGLTGLAYVLISLLVGAVLFPGSLVAAAMTRKVLTALVAGAAGGIIGLNI